MRKKIVIGLCAVIGLAVILTLAFGDKAETPASSTQDTSSANQSEIEADSTDAQDQEPASTGQTQQTNTQTSTQTTSPGKYVEYSEAALSSTKGKRLLFFHASWCPQCRQLEASIKSRTIPDDVTIFKVNYDNSTSLKSKYGVTLQTTVVLIDDNGNLAKKHVAYDEPTLAAITKALL